MLSFCPHSSYCTEDLSQEFSSSHFYWLLLWNSTTNYEWSTYSTTFYSTMSESLQTFSSLSNVHIWINQSFCYCRSGWCDFYFCNFSKFVSSLKTIIGYGCIEIKYLALGYNSSGVVLKHVEGNYLVIITSCPFCLW